MPRPRRRRSRHDRRSGLSGAPRFCNRSPAHGAGAAFLRCHHEWLRRNVPLCEPRHAGRPLGNRRLYPRIASQQRRQARRCSGREAAAIAMNSERAWTRIELAAIAALIIGIVGCAIGIAVSGASVYRAWLCAYVLWLGLPLGAVTLILVHDLTGGAWMASARPVLAAAAVTMPLATLAGIPVLIGLRAIYPWPATGYSNGWYLNTGFFILRYAIDFVIWNAAAAYALWAPRGLAVGVPPGLRWASAIGLLLLAYTAGFASIDWVLSLDPK